MDKEEILFLIDMYISLTHHSFEKRKAWRESEEAERKTIELHNKYGWRVVDQKTQDIKELFK